MLKSAPLQQRPHQEGGWEHFCRQRIRANLTSDKTYYGAATAYSGPAAPRPTPINNQNRRELSPTFDPDLSPVPTQTTTPMPGPVEVVGRRNEPPRAVSSRRNSLARSVDGENRNHPR